MAARNTSSVLPRLESMKMRRRWDPAKRVAADFLHHAKKNRGQTGRFSIGLR